MMWIVRNIFNALNNPNAVNTGGVYPDLAAGITVTTGKSYAYGAWAQVVAGATVVAASWLTGVLTDVFYIATGEVYQGELGFGAGGVEVAQTGSIYKVGHQEATAAGELVFPVWWFSPYPILLAITTRLAARGAAASANNRSLGVTVAYRTGIGT